MFTNERVNFPADLAGTTEEFRELFYKVPNSDWTRIKGFPLPHILAYDLDELILNTPGMKSAEIDEAKVHLAGVLQQAYDCSIDRAYAIMHRIYIPTAEEYEYLCKKEFTEENFSNAPIVKGVYDSVTDELRPWFNFCLSKWNEWHEAHPDAKCTNVTSVAERKELTKFSKVIENEWKALSDEQREGWRR